MPARRKTPARAKSPRKPAQASPPRAGRARASTAARSTAARSTAARNKAAKGTGSSKAHAEQTGAEAAIAQLSVLGVEVVFGIPGVHNLALFDALRRSAIRTVVVRHEQTCVYAADGYARATGRLGVALTTTGPGAANTAAAMGEAKTSRSPVLHLSTQSATAILENRSGRFSLHESPHQRAIMDAVSIWSGSVARAEAIPSMIATAARAAFGGRRGPTFLEVPFDLLDEPVRWEARPVVNDRPFGPDQRSIERALALLSKSRAPLLWVGGGAVSSDAGEQVVALAERLGAPVISTFAGKGIVPRDHALAVGLPPHQPEATRLIEQSDAVIFIGSDLDGMNTQGWRLPFPKRRIAVNTIAEDGRRNYACDVVIEADARETIVALLDELPDDAARTDAKARVKAARAAATKALRPKRAGGEAMSFIRTLNEVLPADAFVLADMAVAGYWTAGYWQAPAPRSFAYPLGWGTLGFAIPAAVGAGAAGRRTVVIAGDAGAMFAIGELATMVQEELDVCVVVVNDEGYGMLRFDEEERFGKTFAVDLGTPDLLGLAKAFGVKAKRCDVTSFEQALRWGVRAKGPTLIELRAAFPPPVTTSPRWPLKANKEARP